MINQKLLYTIRMALLIICSLHFTLFASSPNEKDSLLNLLDKAETSIEKVEAYVALGMYYDKYDLDSADYYSIRANRILNEWSDPIIVKQNLIALGQLQFNPDSLLYMRDYLNKAIEYFEDCDCDSIKAVVYLDLGKLYFFHVIYFEAQQYLIKSLEFSEKVGSRRMQLDAYAFMGHLYSTIGNYADAENAYLEALKFYQEGMDDISKARNLYGLGRSYLNSGNYEQARVQLQGALEVSAKSNFGQGVTASFIELGHVEYSSGNFEKALEYYRMADESLDTMDIKKQITINYLKVLVLLGIGKTYYKLGKFNDAKKVLLEAREIAIINEQLMMQAWASDYLSRCYEKEKKYKTSLVYLKESQHISDSILNVERVTRINRLETDYKHLKEITDKRIKQQAIELKHQESVKLFQIVTVSGISLLLIVILLFFIYRLKQREKSKNAELKAQKLLAEKDKLQSDLDFKNRELTTSVIYLLKKNNFVWNLSEKLKKAIIPLGLEQKKPFQDIIKESDANIGKDTWEDFETRFNNVHQTFTNKLLKDFPELTPNELKLAAFMRLNMTTKEISTITYQSQNSIAVARHRLRTKLGIEREENLVSFLSKY